MAYLTQQLNISAQHCQNLYSKCAPCALTKHVDDGATGRQRHQRSTGQAAPTRRSGSGSGSGSDLDLDDQTCFEFLEASYPGVVNWLTVYNATGRRILPTQPHM